MASRFCKNLAVAALLASSAPASASGIDLVSASYGSPGHGAICDATPAIAVLCNHASSCAVDVMNMSLCGDPDFLVVKQISVAYRCGRRLRAVASPEYTTLQLACP